MVNDMVEIIIAIITGVLTLSGTIITVIAGNNKTRQNLEINQAVINTKIDNLSAEVQKHNTFAVEIPVMKEQMKNIYTRIEVLEHGK